MNVRRAILAGVPFSGLYAITDPVLMPDEQLFIKSEAALRGGARWLQYRNKTASAARKQQEAERLSELCRRYQAAFIINDDASLASMVGASGVHVGQTDAEVSTVRGTLGGRGIVGVSCHGSLEWAKRAEQQGASYVALGRFFDSKTKPTAPPASLEVLQQACQQLSIPVVAIGGITRDNASHVIAQGAQMVAVIHDLFSPDQADEIEARARTFSQLFLK